MKIDITSKNFEANAKLKELIEKKVNRLDRIIKPDSHIKVFCKSEKEVYSMEITVHSGREVIRAEVYGTSMYDNLDDALRKIERQIIKKHTRQHNRSKKEGQREKWQLLFNDNVPDEEPASIVRKKSYEMKPISIDAAIEAFEALDHNFYVFQNEATRQINVIYKRLDGNYGLIEAIVSHED